MVFITAGRTNPDVIVGACSRNGKNSTLSHMFMVWFVVMCGGLAAYRLALQWEEGRQGKLFLI